MLMAVSCSDLSQEDARKVTEALNDSLVSSTETWDLDMTLIEEGLKKVRVQGSYAATYNLPELKETQIKGPVFIDVYDSTGAVKTEVTSDRAIYRAEDAEFELFGNVQVDTRDDKHLESEYLKWNQADNNISTPEFVIIITPSDSLAGNGFEGTADLENWSLKQPKGRVVVD
jgi:LPS export ABC transporter protein LptC